MTYRAPRGNPFDPQTWGRKRVEILWPIGHFGSMDVYQGLSLIDELIEDGDYLGARQMLWAVGRTFVTSVLFDSDSLDDLFIEDQVDRFLEQFEEETG